MPPPNTQQAPSLPTLYSELNRLIIMGDYEKTLKTCNRILHIAPDELKALQCKIVSFIHLGKFNEAINAIIHAKQTDSCIFEQAYCYYRLNKPEEAIKVLDSPNAKDDKRIPELKAQILYRLERYDDCKKVYQDVIKNSHDEYQDERETNLGAVIAGLVATKKNIKVPELRDDTYELCYNKACRLVAEDNFSEAEKVLRKCEKLCMEQLLLDDEETEEEIEDELAIIRVQLAYCLQMQGRESEAQTLYQRVLKHKPDDVTLLAVAANNCVVINSTHNVFDSKKKLKIATSDGVELKLTKAQRKTIAANNCLFNVINSIGNYKAHCDALLKKYPDMEFTAMLAMTLGQMREGNDQDAIHHLLQYAQKDSNNSLQIHLFAAHLALMKENRDEALEILLKLGDDKYLPGVVSTIVTLYVGKEMTDKASKFLDETVDWYRKNRSGKPGLEKMYREAADFHMRNEEPEAAAKCLEEILSLHPNSRQIIAQLVMAYAQIKSPKAKDLSDRLPPINTKGLDVDDLESANWMMGLKSNRSTRPQTSADSPPTTPRDPYARKYKKKRRGKLPKDYVEGETPDPERWLPKYERTGFRKKRDRRAKDIIKGSQGSATNASDAYDFSSYSGGGENTKADVPQHVSHQKSANDHKKKKRRR